MEKKSTSLTEHDRDETMNEIKDDGDDWADNDDEISKLPDYKSQETSTIDPWMQIRFIKCVSSTNSSTTDKWIVKIPNQNHTLANILIDELRNTSNQQLILSITFCGKKIISDRKSGRADVRILLRITMSKSAPLTCQQCLEIALLSAREKLVRLYEEWKLASTEKSSKNFKYLSQDSEQEISFVCANVTQAIANGLRRSMIADCPTIAIDKMAIHKNTSSYLSNFLGLHFAMMPLVSESLGSVLNFTSPLECSCVEKAEDFASHLGCEKCRIRLKIFARHDFKDKKFLPYRVTTRDIQIHADDKNRGISLLPRPMFFIKLAYGQEIDLDVTASKGSLSDHAKFGPCCPAVCVPRLKTITIQNSKLTADQKKEIVSLFPLFFRPCSKDDIEAFNLDNCTDVVKCLCTELVASWGIPNAIKVEHYTDEFEFTVKSTGALPPTDIVKGGLRAMIGKFDTVLDMLPDSIFKIKEGVV